MAPYVHLPAEYTIISRVTGLFSIDDKYRHEKMQDLRCMSYTSRGTSEILVSGIQRNMLTVNVDRGQVISEV